MKKINSYLIFLFLGMTLFLLFGFQKNEKPKEDINVRLRKVVQARLAKRKVQSFNECRKKAIEKAEAKVDSILLARAKTAVIDTISKPIKAIKPDQPEIKTSKDSTPVKPLFDEVPDSLNLDN